MSNSMQADLTDLFLDLLKRRYTNDPEGYDVFLDNFYEAPDPIGWVHTEFGIDFRVLSTASDEELIVSHGSQLKRLTTKHPICGGAKKGYIPKPRPNIQCTDIAPPSDCDDESTKPSQGDTAEPS